MEKIKIIKKKKGVKGMAYGPSKAEKADLIQRHRLGLDCWAG